MSVIRNESSVCIYLYIYREREREILVYIYIYIYIFRKVLYKALEVERGLL